MPTFGRPYKDVDTKSIEKPASGTVRPTIMQIFTPIDPILYPREKYVFLRLYGTPLEGLPSHAITAPFELILSYVTHRRLSTWENIGGLPFPSFSSSPSLPIEVGPHKIQLGVWGSAVSILALKSGISGGNNFNNFPKNQLTKFRAF